MSGALLAADFNAKGRIQDRKPPLVQVGCIVQSHVAGSSISLCTAVFSVLAAFGLSFLIFTDKSDWLDSPVIISVL